MASILGHTVNTFQGRMHEARQRIAVMDSQPGVDGNIVALSGWSSDPIEISTYTLVSGGVVSARITGESYRATQGTLGTVIDQFGVSWPNVRVLGVVYEVNATPSSSLAYLRATWRLLPRVQRPPGR